MNICYLSNNAIPSPVASTIQIVKMCEAFSELNNKVILIATNEIVSKLNFSTFYNIKSKFILKRMKYFKSFPLGINYYLFSVFSILESLKYKPKIYITRNFFTCFLLVILKKNTVMELHHDINTESRIVRFLVTKFKFLNSPCVKKIIAITHGVKNEYVKKNIIKKEKIIVLPSGSSIKKKFEFSNNKKFFKIGYFGSLFQSRGLNLIKNLAKIDRENEYYLYGDFNKVNSLNYKTSTKNIHLHGYIPYKDIPRELKKMDILLMPYVSAITVAGDVGDITKFTSPLKLFDYLSVGKIIICSDFDVLKEIIKDRKNAIFIKNYTNVFSWKKEIKRLKNQPYKQFLISKNNYDLSKKYSLINRANKILEEIKLN
jgi:glycosyltransferase involved in cell wall biosynthesis